MFSITKKIKILEKERTSEQIKLKTFKLFVNNYNILNNFTKKCLAYGADFSTYELAILFIWSKVAISSFNLHKAN